MATEEEMKQQIAELQSELEAARLETKEATKGRQNPELAEKDLSALAAKVSEIESKLPKGSELEDRISEISTKITELENVLKHIDLSRVPAKSKARKTGLLAMLFNEEEEEENQPEGQGVE